MDILSKKQNVQSSLTQQSKKEKLYLSFYLFYYEF